MLFVLSAVVPGPVSVVLGRGQLHDDVGGQHAGELVGGARGAGLVSRYLRDGRQPHRVQRAAVVVVVAVPHGFQ